MIDKNIDWQWVAFFDRYVENAMNEHKGNPYWATIEQTVDNLGGRHSIRQVYDLWEVASSEAQRKSCGFTSTDLGFAQIVY